MTERLRRSAHLFERCSHFGLNLVFFSFEFLSLSQFLRFFLGIFDQNYPNSDPSEGETNYWHWGKYAHECEGCCDSNRPFVVCVVVRRFFECGKRWKRGFGLGLERIKSINIKHTSFKMHHKRTTRFSVKNVAVRHTEDVSVADGPVPQHKQAAERGFEVGQEGERFLSFPFLPQSNCSDTRILQPTNQKINVTANKTPMNAQVDCLYLDMNGIIHPCTHGNSDSFVELNETEMFKKIFMYTDRLYKLAKPGKLLFLAVDGVAPRAKMNQQRSRRFRSSKEAEELMAAVVAREGRLPDSKPFDSNCITPGTDFMLKLSLAMNKWIEYKMQTDPFWSEGATVIFSGPDVPGEGEHKVMDYIRWGQQNDPDWNKDGGLQHGACRRCRFFLSFCNI